MNSAISSTKDIRHNPPVQVWSVRSSLTLLCFLHANLYSFGAMSIGALPCSHVLCQNVAVFPSPSVTIVLILKSCLLVSSQGTRVPTHAGFKHSNCTSKKCLACAAVPPTLSSKAMMTVGTDHCKISKEKLTKEALKTKKQKQAPIGAGRSAESSNKDPIEEGQGSTI
ncbi:hypothetical protein SEVIR_8G052950v4 [Setaria viridis]